MMMNSGLRSQRGKGVVFLSGVLIVFAATYASAQTLTGHWTFDGDLVDGVGGNDAIIPTGSGSTAGTDNGKIGGAITFDGVDDVVQLPTAILGDGPFTLSFWEYTAADCGNSAHMFDGYPSTQFFLQRYYLTYNSKIRRNPILDATSPSLEEWHHSMISYDEDGDFFWYVDGILGGKSDPENSNKKPFISDGGDYSLGNRLEDLARPFSGKIDDLQIYSGALGPDAAAYLYNNPGSTLIPEPNTFMMFLGMILMGFIFHGRHVKAR